MLKICVIIIIMSVGIIGKSSGDNPYCFRFFWIGSYPRKGNIGTETCEDRINKEPIPCRKPIVATDNDNIPDTIALWGEYKHRPDEIACPMSPGKMCVKYTYLHNKAVQNITYMCAKANTTTGCYRQKFTTGSEVEVCICESHEGAMPCNAINRIEHKLSLWLIALITITIFNKLFKNT